MIRFLTHLLKTASTHTLEYILMGVLSVATGYITPGFGWFVRVLLFECYAAIYVFFLFNLMDHSELYVALGCAVGGVIFLTIVNWMFYPIILRFVCSTVPLTSKEPGTHGPPLLHLM